MAVCYRRKLAWLRDGDALLFSEPKENLNDYRKITIPCGKCLACRVNNASVWALRAQHEMCYTSSGCFITLTYDNKNCPKDYSLCKRDLQLFIKNLRRQIEYYKKGEIRSFLACGEYGEKKGRPHYHLLIFGFFPDDVLPYKRTSLGDVLFTSKFIQKIWNKGFITIGASNYKTAGYVARYAKKSVGNDSNKREKPFFLSSRRIPLSDGSFGALGAQWCLDHLDDFRFGFLRHPEKKDIRVKIPQYYFDIIKRVNIDLYDLIKKYRYDYAMDCNDGFFIIGLRNGNVGLYAKEEDVMSHYIYNELLDAYTDDDKTFYRDFEEIYQCRLNKVRRLDDEQTKHLKLLRRQKNEQS